MNFIRYKNRKLYDPENRKYVTLNEIRELIKHDTPVQVLEHNTQTDVTREILVRTLAQQNNMSSETLKTLIKGA